MFRTGSWRYSWCGKSDCGVNTTSKNGQEVAGEGVFIEILRKSLEEKGIIIDMIGIKASEIEKALIDVKRLMDKK